MTVKNKNDRDTVNMASTAALSEPRRKPSRPVGTAAEVVERVVRFVVRSTTD